MDFGFLIVYFMCCSSATLWLHSVLAVLFLVAAILFMRHFSVNLQCDEDEQVQCESVDECTINTVKCPFEKPLFLRANPSGKATGPSKHQHEILISIPDERLHLLKGHISGTKGVASQEWFHCLLQIPCVKMTFNLLANYVLHEWIDDDEKIDKPKFLVTWNQDNQFF